MLIRETRTYEIERRRRKMPIQKTRTYEFERRIPEIGVVQSEITLHPQKDRLYELSIDIHYLPPYFGGRDVEGIPVPYDSAGIDNCYRGRISGSVSIPASSIGRNRRTGAFVRGKQWANLMRSVDEILREVIRRQNLR